MSAMGYIVVIDYHYDTSEQAEEPSTVYLDEAEAWEAAKAYNGPGQTGDVWEIQLP